MIRLFDTHSDMLILAERIRSGSFGHADLGRAAIANLRRFRAGETVTEIRVTPDLVVRQSTAAPKAGRVFAKIRSMGMTDAERKDLEAERARLVIRLGEIDAALRVADVEEEPSGEFVQVLLSSTGLIGIWNSADPVPESGPRTTHDVIVASVRTAGDFGAITNRGRIVRVQAKDLPEVEISEFAPNLGNGAVANEILDLEDDERVLALTTLGTATFGWALGTRKGIVKRTNPEIPRGQDSWEIIRLEGDDEVVGAVELPHEQRHLVFITSAAQLLHYPASTVRSQGRQGGGIVGIKLDSDETAIFFGAASLQDAVVVTNAGRKTDLKTTFPGSIKVTPFNTFPEKGRAT
ncbi:MAG: hypothetical protein LBU38_07960, partial [Propionibacteriaceae bacterium]|nr:hypothetical protein [Propionibacteriaceae bacterium]